MKNTPAVRISKGRREQRRRGNKGHTDSLKNQKKRKMWEGGKRKREDTMR